MTTEPNSDRTALDARVTDARDRLRGMALSLATATGPLVEPSTFADALDEYRDAVAAAVSVGQPARTEDPAVLCEQVADVLADADGWTWAPGFNRRRSPAYQAYLTRADRVVGLLTAYDTTRADARVRALHQQYTFGTDPQDYCAHCNQISGGWIPWPCPTVQALDAAGAQQPETVAAEAQPGDEPCTCRHPKKRHMGDQHERGCYACWDSPGNEGWAHPFTPDGQQPAAGAQQQPTTETPRRCAHTDIVYGRCVLTVPHGSECVHEHQPRCAMPSSDRQHSCVLPPNHEGPHADKHLADVVPNGGRTIWQTPLSAPAPEPLSPVEAAEQLAARHHADGWDQRAQGAQDVADLLRAGEREEQRRG